LISTFGSEGNENGQFNDPRGIAINSKGNIFVSDNENNRIQIFSSEGEFISTFGSKGGDDGQFVNPYGLFIDSNDHIFVCDYENDRIQIFDSEGKYITKFDLLNPTQITIDSKTQKIIACGDNNEVSIFYQKEKQNE